ncbi:Zinc finger, GATA-type [Dillenia turbinata]|uniref:Zinc finger, GATA-type n=1 Tax=Dillenia turbinata TaxID=194707 RepID=A0AAN8UTH6_9MAGN
MCSLSPRSSASANYSLYITTPSLPKQHPLSLRFQFFQCRERKRENSEVGISISLSLSIVRTMDMYGLPIPDNHFRIDDLLDFSNADIFSSPPSTSTTISAVTSAIDSNFHRPENQNPDYSVFPNYYTASSSSNFTDILSVPSEDVAELEWLSNFIHDTSNFPANEQMGAQNLRENRSKRSRAASQWKISAEESETPATGKLNSKRKPSEQSTTEGRKCTHCASEKTPQWRTGPMGPKTLCNACGVRYKSGRLVPEYRPAASPTFVLTQHSNSHRKVMELRRQKEVLRQQHRHCQNFEVC